MRSHSLGIYLGLALLASAAYGWENYCKERGIFSHPEDCTSFISCHGPENNEYKMTSHQCPNGQAFSESERICIPLDEVPECEQEVFSMYNPYASNPACSNKPVHCANCTHLVFCQLVGNEYQNPQYENCAFNGSTTPFCDNSWRACSSLLPPGCDRPGFICTSAGYFPDPTKCDMYHVCYNTTTYDSFSLNKGQQYSNAQCGVPEMPEYHSQEFRCGANNGTACESVDCTGILGVTAFPRDPRYYVLCMSGTKNEIYACPGNTEFISANDGCGFVCHNAGLFPDSQNCTQFYRCDGLLDGPESFDQVLESCPAGLAFNPISLSCDAKANVKC